MISCSIRAKSGCPAFYHAGPGRPGSRLRTVAAPASQEVLGRARRHDAYANQLFHEQASQARAHRIQPRPKGPLIVALRASSRVVYAACALTFRESGRRPIASRRSAPRWKYGQRSGAARRNLPTRSLPPEVSRAQRRGNYGLTTVPFRSFPRSCDQDGLSEPTAPTRSATNLRCSSARSDRRSGCSSGAVPANAQQVIQPDPEARRQVTDAVAKVLASAA